ncbi:unnamed protein product, partial [Didymodactylos carnosus]
MHLDNKRKEVSIVRYAVAQYYHKIVLSRNCLDNYILMHVERNSPEIHVVIPLKRCVRCYKYENENFSERIFQFSDNITKEDLADTSAIHITLKNDHFANEFINFMTNTMNIQCYYAKINVHHAPVQNETLFKLIDNNNFLSNYVWEMVLSLGYQIKDKLSPRLMKQIQQYAHRSKDETYPQHKFYQKIIAIYRCAKDNRFYNIEQKFYDTKPHWIPPTQTNYIYVSRIFLTPYGIYPQPLKPIRSNRVLRQEQFGSETHYCRVLIRDCDMETVQIDLMKSYRNILKEIFLSKQILVGQRKFEFLLCSNSQLRDRSFWFYSSFNGFRSSDILRCMGDFTDEKTVGTLIARMALCFTGTFKGVE